MKHSKLGCKKIGDLYKDRCKVCAEDILVGLHGITALFSHADGTKHKERLPKDTPISGDSSEALSSTQTTISICTNKQLVTKAEIIWALDVVMSKYFFNSTSNKSDVFTTMFPDSRIAKTFLVIKQNVGSL